MHWSVSSQFFLCLVTQIIQKIFGNRKKIRCLFVGYQMKRHMVWCCCARVDNTQTSRADRVADAPALPNQKHRRLGVKCWSKHAVERNFKSNKIFWKKPCCWKGLAFSLYFMTGVIWSFYCNVMRIRFLNAVHAYFCWHPFLLFCSGMLNYLQNQITSRQRQRVQLSEFSLIYSSRSASNRAFVESGPI